PRRSPHACAGRHRPLSPPTRLCQPTVRSPSDLPVSVVQGAAQPLLPRFSGGEAEPLPLRFPAHHNPVAVAVEAIPLRRSVGLEGVSKRVAGLALACIP